MRSPIPSEDGTIYLFKQLVYLLSTPATAKMHWKYNFNSKNLLKTIKYNVMFIYLKHLLLWHVIWLCCTSHRQITMVILSSIVFPLFTWSVWDTVSPFSKPSGFRVAVQIHPDPRKMNWLYLQLRLKNTLNNVWLYPVSSVCKYFRFCSNNTAAFWLHPILDECGSHTRCLCKVMKSLLNERDVRMNKYHTCCGYFFWRN